MRPLQVVSRLLLGLLLVIGLGGRDDAAADTPDPFDAEAAIAYSQAAVGRQVGDYPFVDHQGQRLKLGDYRGKPLVISLIYTACTDVCPLITQHLARAVEVAEEALGADGFAVVTVGFDSANDRPERLRAYARSQGVGGANWRFLSGEADVVEALIGDLGFIRFASPRGFDHLAQTSVIDGQGRVHAQVYGDRFAPPALVEPLKALIFRQVGNLGSLNDLVERVRLFCTFYDPAAGRYAFDYSFFIAVTVGGLSLLGMAGVLLVSWRRASGNPEGRA